MGIMAPQPKKPVINPPKPVEVKPYDPCDNSCGRTAVCEVIVDAAKKLYLRFCLIHYRENAAHILMQGYEVKEL